MDGQSKFSMGDLIRVQHWVGEVVDVAQTDAGRLMLLVASPKGIWRNHPAEWLEYAPEQIRQATPEEIGKDIELYRERIKKMLAELEALDERWRIAHE